MPKAKVSVTVDRSLLRECDRLAGAASRSELFERALRGWLRSVRRRRLEEEIERYYGSRSETDRAEDADWAGLASRRLGETWREP
jgi:hypothetical protein